MTTARTGPAERPRVHRVAVVGARTQVVGFGLAGAVVLVADDDDAVRAAWRALPPGVGVVLLTRAAAAALVGEPPGPDPRLTAVMPV